MFDFGYEEWNPCWMTPTICHDIRLFNDVQILKWSKNNIENDRDKPITILIRGELT